MEATRSSSEPILEGICGAASRPHRDRTGSDESRAGRGAPWQGRDRRIANELLLKLGIRVSPRTVRKYMPKCPPGRPRGDQRWATLLRNHARAIIACDCFVAVTATFRLLYVFVLIHHGARRLVHFNVTAHPTAAWTLQQLREAIGFEANYRYLIHDRTASSRGTSTNRSRASA